MKSTPFLLSVVVLSALHAQTIDTGILGEIRDPSGAAIAAATVTILQPTTGLSRIVTTDSGGHYEVRYLVPGNYNVEAKAPGFRTERQTGIVIQIGQQARIDFDLRAGLVSPQRFPDQVFAHYIYSARDYPNYELNPNFYFSGNFPNDSFAVQEVHTFNPGLLNEVRFGWQRGNVAVLSPRQGSSFRVSDLGITGMDVGGPAGRPLTAPESAFPVIGISGYLGMGDDQASSNLDNSRTYQWVDNLSVIRGLTR